MLLTAGAVSSSCGYDNREIALLYLSVYLACWFAAWETYWIGRTFGPKLFKLRWFSRLLTAERLERIKSYIRRFGIYTFILGRFIPGGRNALFMSMGLTRLPFLRFIARDSIGCFLSTATLFSLGHLFGSHLEEIIEVFKLYRMFFFGTLVFIILLSVLLIYFRKKRTGAASYADVP